MLYLKKFGKFLCSTISGTLNLSNTTVTGDSTGADDHVEVLAGGVLTADGCTFEGNRSSLGGAIYAEDGSFVVLSNTFIVSNSADFGGGLLLRGVTTIVDSELSGNGAQYGGGALLQGNSQLVATTVGGNFADVSGGGLQYGDPGDRLTLDVGLVAVDTNGLMVGGRHAYNEAPSGAAFRIEGGADVLFDAVSADTNLATGSGAAFSVEGATLELQHGKFVLNEADVSGSGLWAGPGATVVDCGSDWLSNGQKGTGGALHVEGGTVLLGDAVVFSDNSATTGPLALVSSGTLGNATTCSGTPRLSVSLHDDPSIYVKAGATFTATGWVVDPLDPHNVFDELSGRSEPLPP